MTTINVVQGSTTINKSASSAVIDETSGAITVNETAGGTTVNQVENTTTIDQTVAVGLPGTSAKRYEHSQAVPSATWTIPHNFGSRPFAVHVVDTSGDDVIGDITHPNLNTTQIDFSASFAGAAYLGG